MLVGSTDAENVAPRANSATRGRARTPSGRSNTPSGSTRPVLGASKTATTEGTTTAPRASVVVPPMRERPPAAAGLNIAPEAACEPADGSIKGAGPSPSTADRFRTSLSCTAFTSPRSSVRNSLDGEMKCEGGIFVASPESGTRGRRHTTTDAMPLVGAGGEADANTGRNRAATTAAVTAIVGPRTAAPITLKDGKNLVESLLMCPSLARASHGAGASEHSHNVSGSPSKQIGIARTFTGGALDSLNISTAMVNGGLIKVSMVSADTDDEDDDLVVLDGMDLWNGMGIPQTPVSAEVAGAGAGAGAGVGLQGTGGNAGLVVCREPHVAGSVCCTPKCVFHTLTPDMTPRKMSLCTSVTATRAASPAPASLSREGSMAVVPSPARVPREVEAGTPGRAQRPSGAPSPFSARIMSSTVSASNKKVTSTTDDASATTAAAAPTTTTTPGKRYTLGLGRAPSPNPSISAPAAAKAASPARGKQAVLTAGELNSRFMNNIRQCDYNKVVTGGAASTAAATKAASPSRGRVQASPTRTLRNGTTMVATGGGPTVKYDEVPPGRIPGSGITRGSATPTRSGSAGRRAASPSTNGKAGAKGAAAATAAATAADDDDITDDPVFPTTAKKRTKKGAAAAGGDGDARGEDGERLSINTLIRQCDILKKITGLSEEDIEWTAVKDNTGAYKHAANKQAKAEDNYYRSVYEMELYSAVKRCVNMSGGCKLYALLQSIVGSSEKFYVNPTDAAEIAKIERERTELMEMLTAPSSHLMAVNMNCQTNYVNPTVISDKLHKLLIDAVETSKEYKDIPRKMKLVVQTHYPAECKDVVDRFARSETLNNDSCQEMEKWEKRKTGTKEYASVQKEAENKWLAEEEEANSEALRTMRSYLTPMMLGNAALGIGSLTLAEFNTLVLDNDGVFSHELMLELKNNKCLHWCIKHVQDIANASFLTGESKAYFESLESFDIIECRALVYALKDLTKFNNDNDGKKMEWRDRLFARCKVLVDQFNGAQVKGPWSGKDGRRVMVKLPALKPDQLRRPVYFHKTYAQYQTKLKQYDDKLALLAKKEAWLVAAKTAYDEAVSEWNTLLAELRDDKLQQLLTTCSKEQIADLKKEASASKIMTEKKYKMLVMEVANLRRAIETNPVSREEFVAAKERLEALLMKEEVPLTYNEITTPTKLLVTGVFDREPLIEKSEVPSGAKFLSPEEEAAQRLAEIQGLKVGDCSASSSVDADRAGGDAAAPAADAPKTPGKISRSLVDALEKPPIAAPRTPVRRGSILDSFNPAHLNSISKSIMKTQTAVHADGAGSGTVRPVLSPMPLKFSATGDAAEPNKPVGPAATAPKDLQSKLLKRMMGVKDENAPAEDSSSIPGGLSPMRMFGGATGGGGLSFLDQIKAGKAGRSVANSPMPGGGPAGGSLTPMSFLDQIKAGKAGRSVANSPMPGGGPAGGSLTPMSFLDQIKARKGQSDDSNSSMPPQPPLSPMGGGMSFLDEIKAKARKE